MLARSAGRRPGCARLRRYRRRAGRGTLWLEVAGRGPWWCAVARPGEVSGQVNTRARVRRPPGGGRSGFRDRYARPRARGECNGKAGALVGGTRPGALGHRSPFRDRRRPLEGFRQPPSRVRTRGARSAPLARPASAGLVRAMARPARVGGRLFMGPLVRACAPTLT